MVLLGDGAQVEARFVPFGDIANPNTREVHRFVQNVREARMSFWTHPMELLGDVGHVESHFSPFGDSVSVSARSAHGLRQMYHRIRNRFGRTQWYS